MRFPHMTCPHRASRGRPRGDQALPLRLSVRWTLVHRHGPVAGLTAVLLGLMACNLDEPVSCVAAVAPAVQVEVRDSISNQPAAYGATGTAVDGSFVDSLRVSGLGLYPPETLLYMRAADEREGTYAITVTKPGYVDWYQANVQVTRGPCHVDTAHLTARLQRAP